MRPGLRAADGVPGSPKRCCGDFEHSDSARERGPKVCPAWEGYIIENTGRMEFWRGTGSHVTIQARLFPAVHHLGAHPPERTSGLRADLAIRSRRACLHLPCARQLHSVYVPSSCFCRHGTHWRGTRLKTITWPRQPCDKDKTASPYLDGAARLLIVRRKENMRNARFALVRISLCLLPYCILRAQGEERTIVMSSGAPGSVTARITGEGQPWRRAGEDGRFRSRIRPAIDPRPENWSLRLGYSTSHPTP